MPLRMWTYDLAREQAPSLDHLREFCRISVESGYNALGFYLEHRFAYPSAPWAHGRGCLSPDMVRQLQDEFPDLQLIPFVNLLGHFEGMLYTEDGKRFREDRLQGMQACPSNPEFLSLCQSLLDDVIETFDSEIVHIGGDETAQLGNCARCQVSSQAYDVDPKAELYARHFAPLAAHVIDRGRRPAAWGDMFLEHPTALDPMPLELLIFDWQYFESPLESSRRFKERGFDVVCCPTLHTYNAAWCHLAQSEANVLAAVEAAHELDAFGVCVTTWECDLFGNYGTLLPAIRGCASLLVANTTTLAETYDDAGAGEWVRLMGVDLPKLGGAFEFSPTRCSLKVRLLLESNPFLAWLHHGEEFSGDLGNRALDLAERAIQCAPGANYRGVAEFLKGAVQFVRFAEQARQAYADRQPGAAVAALAPCRQIFENLEKVALANHLNSGGSLADIERCRLARAHVERAIQRIKAYGDGSLGYLPAFEIITHPRFVPHDQGCWWLINRWAAE